ncbi:MAG: ISNCY family transposase [Coriobacteriia bacterium]|nr:ISNCY family transposase [Coriobacteriia bacterium]
MDDPVYLSPKEELMSEMVKKVLNDGMSYERVAERYGVSERTVRRKVDIYLRLGARGLAHKSRSRLASNRTPVDIEDKILSLYEGRYAGYNFTHFHQKLVEAERIDVSYPTVYSILMAAGHRSPRAHRVRRAESLHPSRPRRKAFGELVQMDASVHAWFGDDTCNLHLAIDDASSTVLGGHFEAQETLHGYFMVFAQIIGGYGVPEEFYTDRRTVFCSKRARSARLEDDTGTQFRLAASKLGVLEIHVTSVPQAKGRIERAFQTFQDRLISEMRTAKIASIEEANAFLPGFIADHNARYALDTSRMHNAFAEGPSGKELSIALSVVCERTVHNGSYVTFKNKTYLPFDRKRRVLIKSGTKVFVLRTLDDDLYLVHGNDLWPLLCLETAALPDPNDLKDRTYVPPKDHPWKETSYQMMLKRLRKAV